MATDTAAPTTQQTDEQARPFRWSTYVHVGDGANECPDHGADCQEPEHLHVWLRLANPFVRDDLRARALAARARRLRQLRDPESDTALVLDAELEELRAAAERAGNTEPLIEQVLLKGWGDRHLEAMRDVADDDEFRHIDDDRERFGELADLPAAERPTEEYQELDRHITEYGKRVEARRGELEQPLRAAIETKTVDELLDLIRDDRLNALGNAAFFDTWVRQSLLAGCFRPEPGATRPTVAMFDGERALDTLTPPEVEALRSAFIELETQFQAGLGNA